MVVCILRSLRKDTLYFSASTLSVTLIFSLIVFFDTHGDPETKNSSHHLLHPSPRQGLVEKGSRRWKSVLVNSKDFVSQVASSRFSTGAAPLPNDSAMTTLEQSKALFLWPHKLPGAPVKEGDRQTDYTACLQVVIQPCLTLHLSSAHLFLHLASCLPVSEALDPYYNFGK